VCQQQFSTTGGVSAYRGRIGELFISLITMYTQICELFISLIIMYTQICEDGQYFISQNNDFN